MKHISEEFRKNYLFYENARRQLEAYILDINSDYDFYNPINYVRTRIKSFESIIEKLKRKNLSISKENVENLSDIVGAQIVVSFIENIYEIVLKFKKNNKIKIICEKNYIDNPKQSGYRGYHLIGYVPISVNGITKNIYWEIQIKTLAMDWWALSGHNLVYKSKSCSTLSQIKWANIAERIWCFDSSINTLYVQHKQNLNRM